jgi:hypothetical protein
MIVHTSIQEARGVGDIIGVSWRLYDVDEFRRAMDSERERASHDLHTDVSHDDPLVTGMNALAHIKSAPQRKGEVLADKLGDARDGPRKA